MLYISCLLLFCFFFFFNDTATTEIYTFPYTTLFRSVAIKQYQRDSSLQSIIMTNAEIAIASSITSSAGPCARCAKPRARDVRRRCAALPRDDGWRCDM